MQERRLRRLQVEGRLIVAVDRDLAQVLVPDLARVLAEVRATSPLPISMCQVHCTSLAVNGLPSCHFTPWRSLKVSFVLVVVPRPARRQVGHDRVDALVRLRWIEHHEVVEDRHERAVDRHRRLLEDRGARRVVAVIDAQRAALLLRGGGAGGAGQCKQRERRRSQASRHDIPPGGTATLDAFLNWRRT